MSSTSKALVPGSIGALAQQQNVSIAESFLSADVIILVDVSGSMHAADSRGGRRRYDVAVEELTLLQRDMPGKVAVIAFSNDTQFVPGGVPPFLSGGTDLARALEFVKVADGCVKFVVISDGWPDDSERCIQIASTFRSQISTVYVGPKGDRRGAEFLERLARVHGGQFLVADRAVQLAERVEHLMLTAG